MENNKIITMNNKLNIPVIYDHVDKDKIFIPFSINLNRNNINNGNYIYIYENILNGKYYLKITYRLSRFKLYGIYLSFK